MTAHLELLAKGRVLYSYRTSLQHNTVNYLSLLFKLWLSLPSLCATFTPSAANFSSLRLLLNHFQVSTTPHPIETQFETTNQLDISFHHFRHSTFWPPLLPFDIPATSRLLFFAHRFRKYRHGNLSETALESSWLLLPHLSCPDTHPRNTSPPPIFTTHPPETTTHTPSPITNASL